MNRKLAPIRVPRLGADLGVVECCFIPEVHCLNVGEERCECGGILGTPGRDFDAVQQFSLRDDRHAHVAHLDGLEAPEHVGCERFMMKAHVSVSSM
jgi:hypothetical protein